MTTMVATYGSRAGRRRRNKSFDPMGIQKFKRIHVHGVALVNSMPKQSLPNEFEFAALHDHAVLTNLLHLLIKLHSLLCVKCMPQFMQGTEITGCFWT